MTPYRIKGVDSGKVNEATEYSQSVDHFLKNIFNAENPVLIALPEWGQGSPAGTEKPEESEVNYILFCFISELVLHNSVHNVSVLMFVALGTPNSINTAIAENILMLKLMQSSTKAHAITSTFMKVVMFSYTDTLSYLLLNQCLSKTVSTKTLYCRLRIMIK